MTTPPTKSTKFDHEMMELALHNAGQASENGDVPIGALVVDNQGKVIGSGYNQKEAKNIATYHAEILAIEEACRNLGSWRLEECTIYCTLEPCVMCMGAIYLSRIKRVVYAATDPKAGAQSLFNIPADSRLNHRPQLCSGVNQEKSASLLKRFFRDLRTNKSKRT